MMQATKIIGITDEVGTCDCCGRTDLKRTVMLLIGQAESIAYYGCACAAKAMGRRTAKSVEKLAVAAQAIADHKAETKAFYAAFLSDEVRMLAAFKASVDAGSFEQFTATIERHALEAA